MNRIAYVLIWLAVHRAIISQSEDERLQDSMEKPVILDDSRSMGFSNFNSTIYIARQIPDYFHMHDYNAHVAVLTFSNVSTLVVNLTSDERKVRNFNARWVSGYTTNTWLAFNAAKKLLDNPRVQALKIVILFTDGVPANQTLAEEAAIELQRDAFLIYIVFFPPGSDVTENISSSIRKHLDNLAGDHSQVFPLSKFKDLTADIFRRIRDMIIKDIHRCYLSATCKFKNSSQHECVVYVYYPNAVDKPCRGAGHMVVPVDACQHAGACDRVCDRRWPWIWPCAQNGTRINATAKRNESMYPELKVVLYACPSTKVVTCEVVKRVQEMSTKEGPMDGIKKTTDSNSWLLPTTIVLGVVVLLAVVLLVVVQAMKKGKPVIATKAPAMVETAAAPVLSRKHAKAMSSKSAIATKQAGGKSQVVLHGYARGATDESVQANIEGGKSTAKKPQSMISKSAKLPIGKKQ